MDINGDELSAQWISSLREAKGAYFALNRDMKNIPKLLYKAYSKEVLEPIEKPLKLGWIKKRQNSNFFKSCYIAGISLGMVFYIKIKA